MRTLRSLLPEWKHKELLMLVLSRRLNQSIVIAGEVRVTVLTISQSRVELGVEAPREIAVDREEIHVRRQVEAGSGNVFADLGFADAGGIKSKLALGVAIKREIVARGWSEARAAEVLAISPLQVAALLSYRLEEFSVERLASLFRVLTPSRCRIRASTDDPQQERKGT
jgi:carbon storage regulator CsrA